MSCHRQQVSAAICGFIEEVTGEKVTQADWHGLVAAAREDGYQTGRTRLDIHSTIYALRGLGKSADNEAAAEAALVNIGYTDEGRAGMSIDAVDGKFPPYTQNMAAVVQYLTNNGVGESLDKVRGGKKPAEPSTVAEAKPESEAPMTTLGGMDFTISTEPYSGYPDGKVTILTGKRGGRYFLRPFRGEHDGTFEIISEKTGQPLRDKALRAIKVMAMGDVIERAE